jgi:intein-encoded DNA endonuclease-like protein
MKADEAYLRGALGDAYLDFKRNELQFYQKNRQWLDLINDILYGLIGERGSITKRDVFLLRKKSKKLFVELRRILAEDVSDSNDFVAGLFDSEGSAYLSSKSRIPVLDITQSEKGKTLLEVSKVVLAKAGIRSFLNGPYKHWNSKLPTYHLRVYGVRYCSQFMDEFPIRHPDKLYRLNTYLSRTRDPRL